MILAVRRGALGRRWTPRLVKRHAWLSRGALLGDLRHVLVPLSHCQPLTLLPCGIVPGGLAGSAKASSNAESRSLSAREALVEGRCGGDDLGGWGRVGKRLRKDRRPGGARAHADGRKHTSRKRRGLFGSRMELRLRSQLRVGRITKPQHGEATVFVGLGLDGRRGGSVGQVEGNGRAIETAGGRREAVGGMVSGVRDRDGNAGHGRVFGDRGEGGRQIGRRGEFGFGAAQGQVWDGETGRREEGVPPHVRVARHVVGAASEERHGLVLGTFVIVH